MEGTSQRHDELGSADPQARRPHPPPTAVEMGGRPATPHDPHRGEVNFRAGYAEVRIVCVEGFAFTPWEIEHVQHTDSGSMT